MKNQVISVTDFKAGCLALLDRIGKDGGTITITKRGRPLATVSRAEERSEKSPEGSWAKKITLVRDLLPSETYGHWDALPEDEQGRV